MRWGTRRIAGLAGVCALAALMVAAPSGTGSGKRKIDVRPGPDAIADAVARADAGDVLRIHGGRYHEALTIDKPVKLVGAGKRRPVIDGDCETNITVGVRHAGVGLVHLKVVGAEEGFGSFPSAVDFNGVATGLVRDLVVRNTCEEAEYGINVFDGGRITLRDNRGVGFTDAAYYIGGINDTGGGALVVRNNRASGNNRGVIVEDSAGVDIRVRENDLHGNVLGGEGPPAGIFLHNSDGILIEGNSANGNGLYGIQLDPDSSGNVLNDNIARGNPTDFLDEGSGNCGAGNGFDTGDPLPPC